MSCLWKSWKNTKDNAAQWRPSMNYQARLFMHAVTRSARPLITKPRSNLWLKADSFVSFGSRMFLYRKLSDYFWRFWWFVWLHISGCVLQLDNILPIRSVINNGNGLCFQKIIILCIWQVFTQNVLQTTDIKRSVKLSFPVSFPFPKIMKVKLSVYVMTSEPDWSSGGVAFKNNVHTPTGAWLEREKNAQFGGQFGGQNVAIVTRRKKIIKIDPKDYHIR